MNRVQKKNFGFIFYVFCINNKILFDIEVLRVGGEFVLDLQ